MRIWLFIGVGAVALFAACESTPSTAGPKLKPKPTSAQPSTAVERARKQLADLNATQIALTAAYIEQRNFLLSMPQDSPPTREITRLLAIINSKAQPLLGQVFIAELALEREIEAEIQPDELAVLIKQAYDGNSSSQFKLGWAYENGKGFPPNYSESVKWYRIGAEQNDAKSQLNLGHMYFNGKGVSKDLVFAHAWWDIASSNGLADAKTNMVFVSKQMSPEQISIAKKLSGQLQAMIMKKRNDPE